MKNVIAVVTITVGTVVALALSGDGPTRGQRAAAAAVEVPTASEPARAPRWVYRVVSTRAALPDEARRRKPGADVRFVAWSAETDALKAVERELNRLSGEGWEMCSAADGTMVFRRPN